MYNFVNFHHTIELLFLTSRNQTSFLFLLFSINKIENNKIKEEILSRIQNKEGKSRKI